MKIYKFISIITVLVLTFSSCEDVLDVLPSDKVDTKQAFSRIEDFEFAVDGLYDLIRNDGYYESFVLYPDIMSDNIIQNFDGRKSHQTLYTWKYTSLTSDIEVFWANAYKTIHGANMILERIDAFENGTDKQKNAIKGEALAIRALVHFDLVRYFGKPVHSSASSPGVPYMLKVENGKPARNTVAQCYDNLIADLKEAESLLNGSGRSNVYFTSDAVAALLARVYLTKKDYPNAIIYASKVISNTSYELTSTSDFDGMWKKDNTGKEVILKLRCTDKEGPRIGGLYGVKESSEFVPTFEFFSMFADEDVRKEAYFTLTEIPSTSRKHNFMTKYINREGVEDGLNLSDIVILRLAEQYLIRAEAYAESDDDANALIDLDAIRKNRYIDFVTGSETGQALKDAIAKERRLELAFEGHRWFDLKRKDMDVIRNADYGHEHDGSGTKSTNTYLPVSDIHRLWPIPHAERAINPNCDQNDGY